MSIKLCLYSPPFPGTKSYYEVIDLAVKYGLSGVEGFCQYELATPDTDAAKRIREYADSRNIIFPCFSVYALYAADKDTTEMMKRYVDVAKILGSPYLHHTIVGECEHMDKVMPYKEELFENGVRAVREIYDYCESIGIKAIYEEQGYIFNGIEEYGRFLEAVDRPVGVVADFGNIYESKDSLSDFLKAYGHRAVHAHIKDVVLTADNPDGTGLESMTGKYMHEAEVGKGIVDIKEAITMLKSFGYDGYYGLEFSAKENNSTYIADSIKLIQSLDN